MSAEKLVLELRPSPCGGTELHWRGCEPGASLQGWYKSNTQARKAHAAMPLAKDGSKIRLILSGDKTTICSCCP